MAGQSLAEYEAYLTEQVAAADNAAQEEEFETSVEPEPKENVGSALLGWGKRLPRNIGVSAFKAVLNTAESLDDVFEGSVFNQLNRQASQMQADAKGEPAPEEPPPPLRTLFPGVFESAHEVANSINQGNKFPQTGSTAANIALSDDVFQSLAQFAIPFTGYLKAFGGMKGVSTMAKARNVVLAEGLTAATAFEAHEARVADLVEMGRQMENKFGETLNAMFPPGSLQNEFIDYMTSREDESALEGRWKNAVDSVVTTAALGLFLKTSAVALKQAARGAVRLKDIPMKRFKEAEAAAVKPEPAAPTHTAGETGDHTVEIPGTGRAEAQEGDGVLQMKRIDVQAEQQGQGRGMEMMERMVQEAESRGLRFTSDVSVSPDAVRLYEGLERRGYEVVRNPAAKVNPDTGNLVSDDLRTPVFEVKGKQ